jgi:hypothetical protein
MPLTLEQLESRLAPASVLAFTDVDGDRVAVTSNRGDLTARGTFAAVGAGQQLRSLDLTDPAFQGAALTTRVTRAPGGDGLVNIGHIDATGRDLAKVTVHGDLGAIDAGDGDPAGPALGLLTVRSMGRYGLATQGGTGDLTSHFDGALGSLRVARDMRGASIDVTDTGGATGRIGSADIGGSVVGSVESGAALTARDGIGPVSIRGDLVAVILSPGDLAGVSVGGSVRGGLGGANGMILSSQGRVGPVRIGGDLVGGPDSISGLVSGLTGVARVTVGGSVRGGGFNSGLIRSGGDLGPVRIEGDLIGGSGPDSGEVGAFGRLASLTVGGSIIGGSGSQDQEPSLAGQVYAAGGVGPVRVGGDVVGGAGSGTALIRSGGDLGPVRIEGDLVGGSGAGSGQVAAFGRLASLTVGGSVVGGSGPHDQNPSRPGQVFAVGDMGPVRVRGDVVGGDGPATGLIRSHGNLGPVSIGGSLLGGRGDFAGTVLTFGHLAGVTVGGSVLGDRGLTGLLYAAGDLGPVRIGGDLRGGSISGTEPDHPGSGAIVADRIASVSIGGSVVAGTDTSTAGALLLNASIRAMADLGPVMVRGSLVGNRTADGDSPVVIAARGQTALAPGATTDLAIKSLTVGGRVEHARILAGYDFELIPVNGNASVGAVSVGGDWLASSLVAGVRDVSGDGFGTADDAIINGAGDAIQARIDRVSIRGLVDGSGAPGDHHGFVAERIGSFRAGGIAAPLTVGTDVIELSPLTGDVTIREV